MTIYRDSLGQLVNTPSMPSGGSTVDGPLSTNLPDIVNYYNQEDGLTSWSSFSLADDLYEQTPVAPTNVIAIAIELGATITWDLVDDPDIILYEIFYDTNSDPSGSTSAGTIFGTSFDVVDLTAGTLYYFWVKSIKTIKNVQIKSVYSDSASATPLEMSGLTAGDYNLLKNADFRILEGDTAPFYWDLVSDFGYNPFGKNLDWDLVNTQTYGWDTLPVVLNGGHTFTAVFFNSFTLSQDVYITPGKDYIASVYLGNFGGTITAKVEYLSEDESILSTHTVGELSTNIPTGTAGGKTLDRYNRVFLKTTAEADATIIRFSLIGEGTFTLYTPPSGGGSADIWEFSVAVSAIELTPLDIPAGYTFMGVDGPTGTWTARLADLPSWPYVGGEGYLGENPGGGTYGYFGHRMRLICNALPWATPVSGPHNGTILDCGQQAIWEFPTLSTATTINFMPDDDPKTDNAGTVYITGRLSKVNLPDPSGTNPVTDIVFMLKPMIEEAKEGQTEPSPWTPSIGEIGGLDKFTIKNVPTFFELLSITNAIIGNYIQSDNYVPATSGWRIQKNPALAEFNGVDFVLRDRDGNILLSVDGLGNGLGITGGGKNLLKNPQLIDLTSGTPANWTVSNAAGTIVRQLDVTTSKIFPSGHTYEIISSGSEVLNTSSDTYQEVSISENKYYEASVYVGVDNCKAELDLQYYDAGNNLLDTFSDIVLSSDGFTGGTTESAFDRLFLLQKSPANTAKARFTVKKYASDDTGAVALDPYFSYVSILYHFNESVGATTFTNSKSGGLTVSQLDSFALAKIENKNITDFSSNCLCNIGSSNTGLNFSGNALPATGDFTVEGFLWLYSPVGTSSSWLPSDVTGLCYWGDASDTANTTNIADKSSSGNTPTAGSVTFSTDGQGRRWAYFNGSSALTKASPSGFATGNSACTIAISLINQTNTTVAEALGWGNNTTNYQRFGVQVTDVTGATNTLGLEFRNAGTGCLHNYNNPSVIVLQYLGNKISNVKLFADGKKIYDSTSASGTQTLSVTNTEFKIGGIPNASAGYFKGYIGEICIYNSLLSETDVAFLQNYLLYKWCQQVTLPSQYKNIFCQGNTLGVGSGTFVFGITNADKYRIYFNGTDHISTTAPVVNQKTFFKLKRVGTTFTATIGTTEIINFTSSASISQTGTTNLGNSNFTGGPIYNYPGYIDEVRVTAYNRTDTTVPTEEFSTIESVTSSAYIARAFFAESFASASPSAWSDTVGAISAIDQLDIQNITTYIAAAAMAKLVVDGGAIHAPQAVTVASQALTQPSGTGAAEATTAITSLVLPVIDTVASRRIIDITFQLTHTDSSPGYFYVVIKNNGSEVVRFRSDPTARQIAAANINTYTYKYYLDTAVGVASTVSVEIILKNGNGSPNYWGSGVTVTNFILEIATGAVTA